MLKVICIFVVALVVLKVMLIVVRAVLFAIGLRVSNKKYFPEARSEYREAFMLECSGDMLEDPEVKKLDAAIKRIDRENKKMGERRKKLEKALADLK